MTSRFWAVLLGALFVFLIAPPVQAQDFTIDRFHSDITIRPDSSFTVTESVDVEFHRPRHGIYREIPFRYRDELGKSVETPLLVRSVADNAGKPWPFRISTTGDQVHIRIGDPKRYVNGRQSYVITYEVENAVLFLEDHDELYWNVTGNFWKAPIKESSATVNLAAGRSIDLRAACYTGVQGAQESRCRYEASGNIGEFVATKRLETGEGLTIAFGWSKGIVSPPSAWKRLWWALNPSVNWVFIFPLASLVFMVRHWRLYGRDPKVRESITVQYAPPTSEGRHLAPGEAGALVDERLDTRDITSTIVGLAVKGYLKIEETKKEGLIFDTADYYIRKVKAPDAGLSVFEADLFRRLLPGEVPGTMVSELKNKFYVNIGPLRETVYKELVRKGYFLRSPEKIRNYYRIGGVVTGILAAVAGGAFYALFTYYSGPLHIIAGILSALPVLAFSGSMPAKTRSGSAAYTDLLGFQEFMNRAEKDRLERMGDRDLFSKFLPYAIALDVADNWARAFEGIDQAPPDWYVSSSGFRTFSPTGFSRSVGSLASSLGTAVYSAPRGSGSGGSGGGGSSGGGFGGGGGGSW